MTQARTRAVNATGSSGSGATGWPAGAARPGARWAHALVALTAASGFVLVAILNAVGAYGPAAPAKEHTYGDSGTGLSGVIGRLADHFSYFTEWSNVVVAVAFGLLALRPGRVILRRRVLLLSSLLMITVTAIVYRVLLAPTQVVEGWSVLTNPWQHIVVPLLAVGVWLVWGPRGWLTPRLLPRALIIPIAWVAWALVRGLVIGVYPYGFLDAKTYGYASVFTTIGLILLFAFVVAAIYWLLDRVLSRRSRAGAR